MTGARLTVGPTSEDEFRAILRAGGRRGEIYRRLDELRRRYEPLIRARFPQIPRRVSGYENLDQLFPENGMNVARALVGTEGTCVTVLEATLNLIPNPAERVIAIIGFPDIFQAADAVPRVLEHKPIGLEGFDQTMIDRYKAKGLHADDLKVLPEGRGLAARRVRGRYRGGGGAKGAGARGRVQGRRPSPSGRHSGRRSSNPGGDRQGRLPPPPWSGACRRRRRRCRRDGTPTTTSSPCRPLGRSRPRPASCLPAAAP